MSITKYEAIGFFKTKAPMKLRAKGIITIEEYSRNDQNLFIINGKYCVRSIVKESMNHNMRNQNFKPQISGCILTISEAAHIRNSWKEER